MGNEQNRPSTTGNLTHLAKAFFLKLRIAHGQHFVNDKNLGLQMRCDREGEPDIHAARVALHRRIQEAFHLGEGDDLVEFTLYFSARHAEDRAVQEDVFAPCELGVEACADLQQAGHPAPNSYPPFARLGDARKDLQQRAFPCAIAANNTQDLTTPYPKAHVLKSPELLGHVAGDKRAASEKVRRRTRPALCCTRDHVAKRNVSLPLGLLADHVLFTTTRASNDNLVTHGQIASANVCSIRRNDTIPIR